MNEKHCSTQRFLMASLALAAFAGALCGQQKSNDPSKRNALKPLPQVVVTGAVETPSRFEFRENVRLKEIIECAGGPNKFASEKLQILNSAAPRCRNCSGADVGQIPNLYNLSAAMRGEESSNPIVQAGDVIVVWELEPIFVTGFVLQPQAMSSRGSITVSQAIAQAGGLTKYGKTKPIRVYRSTAGLAELTTLTVDLKAIIKGRAEDLVLQPFDVVDVPGKDDGGDVFSHASDAFQGLPLRLICQDWKSVL